MVILQTSKKAEFLLRKDTNIYAHKKQVINNAKASREDESIFSMDIYFNIKPIPNAVKKVAILSLKIPDIE